MRSFLYLALLVVGACLVAAQAGAQPGLPQIGPPSLEPAGLQSALIESITGVFAGEQSDLPAVDRRRDVEIFTIDPFPGRDVPQIFWYYRRGLEVALVRQRKAAPLVYLIAGTGSSIRSPSVQTLARVLHGLGAHVLIIPSPTHPSFIVTASATFVPGRPSQDANDLYRIMKLARARLGDRIAVTRSHLAGFSLGALNAAFVADLDSREREIGFERTVLLNSPVDLVASAQIVDDFLDRFVAKDPLAVQRFVDTVLDALAQVYLESRDPDISPEVIYRTLNVLERSQEVLEQLVGFSFRLSTSNMAFTTDVLTHRGYFVASDARLRITTSLTDVFSVSFRQNLRDYIDEIVVPFYQGRDPSLTREALLTEPRLATLDPFLLGNGSVFAITNRNDIILAPGELDELARIFGPRLITFPDGGHGGGFTRPEFQDALKRALGL